MRSKFVYYSSIKICALGFDKFFKRIFCLLLVVEAFSLQKAAEVLEEVVISWREVRWIWQMKQSFVTQFVQLLKRWLCTLQSGVVMEKNWNHSVDQCQLQALQFSVHLIDLLSILLRCNVFAGIQKAVVDQTRSRPPVTMTFFCCCKFGFGKCFRASSWSNHWTCVHIKIHFRSHVIIQLRNATLLLHRIREDNTSKWWFFLIFSQLTRQPLKEIFNLHNLLQMPNDHRMINTEFFGNFLCSSKRTRFNDCCHLFIVNIWWPATHYSSSRLSSFYKTSWTTTALYICWQFLGQIGCLLILRDVFAALWPTLNSRKSLELAFCLTSCP